jgi:hypothetical protein
LDHPITRTFFNCKEYWRWSVVRGAGRACPEGARRRAAGGKAEASENGPSTHWQQRVFLNFCNL